jgi:hypothetical protein
MRHRQPLEAPAEVEDPAETLRLLMLATQIFAELLLLSLTYTGGYQPRKRAPRPAERQAMSANS